MYLVNFYGTDQNKYDKLLTLWTEYSHAIIVATKMTKNLNRFFNSNYL